MKPRLKHLIVVAVPTLAAGALVAGSSAPAQGPASRTITLMELDKGSTFKHIRNTKAGHRANSPGDVFAFTAPLTDVSGKPVGKLHYSCVTTAGSSNFERSRANCGGVLAVADGTLTVQFLLDPSKSTTTAAVTGGTGAYANARGTVVSKDTKAGADDTIVLAD